jgi:ActR/RegA family two-component response regulator
MTNAPTILLLDEENMMREATALLLANRGAKVTAAASVDEALAHLEQQTFDVAIIDLADGDDACADILELMRDRNCVPRKVIVCSYGSVPQVDAVEFTEVLLKPYPFDRLIDAVFGDGTQRRESRSGVFPLVRRVKTLRRVSQARRGRV